MYMQFHEKLDFLMRIAAVTNSQLARAASLDNSFISRLRSGARTPSRNENYISLFASFFSRHLTQEYQKASFCEAAGIPLSRITGQEGELETLLESWLSGERSGGQQSVRRFVDGLSLFPRSSVSSEVLPDTAAIPSGQDFQGQVFYGRPGKQAATLTFLQKVLSLKRPVTLSLFSEEDMDWMTGDTAFLKNWAALMTRVIASGHRIRIIHTVNRSLDEMMAAISQWLPLYMTGSIEPYYYPKHRDGVYRRTLFLAPGCAAVTSDCVESQKETTMNLLMEDPGILVSLEEEFARYLALCRPLIHIFTREQAGDFQTVMEEFESEPAHCIIRSGGFSSLTMPADLIRSLAARLPELSDENQQLAIQKSRTAVLEKLLDSHSVTEVIPLPDPEMVRSGQVPLGAGSLHTGKPVFYSPEEYRMHLERVLSLLNRFPGYQVFLQEQTDRENLTIYCREDRGVLITRNQQPFVMFAVSESSMTSAYWDYLKQEIRRIPREHRDRDQVRGKLETLLRLLA